MHQKDQEITAWIAHCQANPLTEEDIPMSRLNLADVAAFHENRNTPFTWEKGWIYIVNRMQGLKPMYPRLFVDANFRVIQTTANSVTVDLQFNNPNIIQETMDESRYRPALDKYFENCTVDVDNFEDHTKEAGYTHRYRLTITLTFH